MHDWENHKVLSRRRTRPLTMDREVDMSGYDDLVRMDLLPFRREGVRAKYEGSIDKAGGNADWDWCLYRDGKGEYVLFDVEGPGCVLNFVQHRYPTSEEPEFRFYFDREESPRFSIRHSEFGERYPFVEPLASRYIGPPEGGRGPIRVVRSFVPMPFRSACRITSTVKLEGFDKTRGEGGWGHVVYHVHAGPAGIRTFDPEDDLGALVRLWKNVGQDPKGIPDLLRTERHGLAIPAGGSATLLDARGAGAVTSIQCRTPRGLVPDAGLWIRATWDGHGTPDLEIPLGCLFANELGLNRTRYLMAGLEPDGTSYCHFAMPFWTSARIEIENRGAAEAAIPWIAIRTAADPDLYPEADCLYFRASPYYARRATKGSDSLLADVRGYGHVVSALITGHGSHEHEVTCEGDVRVHFDGILTPQIESDGSESYSCYGWGFATPPETHPAGGYDGQMHSPWSMNRHCLGDWYPFDRGFRFGIESGGDNDQYLEHSGAILYYGRDGAAARTTDVVDIGDPESERAHGYAVEGPCRRVRLESAFEGDDDHVLLADEGRTGMTESRFEIAIEAANRGVRLRRRSDQEQGRQCAQVWVDGREIAGRRWYVADRNPIKRWLEDEFEIPAAFTEGRTRLAVRIVPVPLDGACSWNEYRYQADTLLRKQG